MKKTYIDEIARGTGGEVYARAKNEAELGVTKVAIDSRDVSADTLFFCIIGARHDAHDFLEDVYEAGCRYVVLSDEAWAEKMRSKGDMNVVKVADTTRALMSLAETYMDDWKGLKRVAVTGSVGKTGTKEMIYSVVSTEYKAAKTKGNLNSEYGIPLTVFGFPEDIELAVIEMGIGYGSSMDELEKIVKPDIAAITTIGSSHLEVFKTKENLTRAKLQVAGGLKERGGALVVNADCDELSPENIERLTGGGFDVVAVGSGEACDYRISDIKDKGINGSECLLTVSSGKYAGKKYGLYLSAPGVHNLINAAEAVAVGALLGVDPEKGAAALEEASLTDKRLDVTEGRNFTVINDAYNASPESMIAALKVLASDKEKRKVAFLGSMFELGSGSAELHEKVGEAAAELDIDVIVTIGKEGEAIAKAAERSGSTGIIKSYAEKEEAISDLKNILKKGDIVLAKASRSMELDKVADAVLELDKKISVAEELRTCS